MPFALGVLLGEKPDDVSRGEMDSGEFEIRESEDSGQLRLTLLGELDVTVASALRARFEELHAEGRSVLMDLSGLEFMDSTGVAIMIWAIESSRSDRWTFVIDPDLSPQVRKLFQ